MLKLYGGARSRATIIQWQLEELAIPYEFVMLDMQAGEHRQEAFLGINPFGKVPAIVDDDIKLWESGAILLYLAQKYSPVKYSPEQQAEFAQWILFANATLGPGIFVEANREKEMPRLMTGLNGIFEHQPFLMGNEFTVADIAVASILSYIPMLLKIDLSEYTYIAKYMQQMQERPAFAKTFAKMA
jgi:glutathione S-transferase